MKRCAGTHGCGKEKDLSCFRKNPVRGTYYTTCIPCERQYKKTKREENKLKTPAEKLAFLTKCSNELILTEGMAPGGLYKRCLSCQEIRLSAWFNNCSSTKDGLQEKCTTCDKESYRGRKEKPIVSPTAEKKCNECFTVKSVDEFAKSTLSPDGVRNKCKACTGNDPYQPHSHEYLIRRTQRLCDEYGIPYVDGLLLKKCPDCPTPTTFNHFAESNETGDRLYARCILHNVYHDNGTFHGFKMAANQKLLKAIRRGDVVRPDTCEFCGAGGKIEAHHIDYSKALDVKWLCTSCHAEWHRTHDFVVHFFRKDTPMDVITNSMKKYAMHFHIETTNHMSTYVGVAFK